MSAEYQAKQAELVAAHIAKQDIVITTALIPGRPAPKLVTRGDGGIHEARLGDRRPRGRARRQLRGGASRARWCEHNGVKIVGHLNVPGRLAATASALYARNLYAFVETLVDKETKTLAVKWDDELVKATCLTRDGADRPHRPSSRRLEHRGDDIMAPHARTGRRAIPRRGRRPPSGRPTRPRPSPTRWRSAASRGARTAAVDPTVFRLAIFVLAIFVGYYVVWR